MHAIIKTGGKQYCVNPNDIIKVEKLDLKAGSSLEINEVLMIKNGTKITSGNPFVSGAIVKAEVLEQKRAQSITVFKKKRRHNYRRTHGHKQPQTVLKVVDILVDKISISKTSKATLKTKEIKETKEGKTNITSTKSKEVAESKEKKQAKEVKKVTKEE